MEADRTVRVTVLQVEGVHVAQATVITGPNVGVYASSGERRTEEAALRDCFARLVDELAHHNGHG